MNCKEINESIMDRYFDNELNADEIRELREHLSNCSQCSSDFKSYRKIVDFQKTRLSLASSSIGRDKLVKKLKRRKALPMQIAIGFAAITLSFFGTKTYMAVSYTHLRAHET